MRYTLITGASGGIGLELARVFAAKAHNLILVARREGALQNVANELAEEFGISVHYYAADLSQIEEAKGLVHWTRQKGFDVEILVNNAGFGSYGEFHKSNLTHEWEMLQLNMVTLMYLTRAYLPSMVFRGRGGVMNVASVAAFVPGPRMANYYASKAYVLSFTEALAGELKNTRLKISALCPGPVKTNFNDRAKVKLRNRIVRTDKHSLSAKEVAEFAYKGFQEGKVVLIPGKTMQWAAFLGRKLPKETVRWFMSIFQ